jgi:hypothetical protein
MGASESVPVEIADPFSVGVQLGAAWCHSWVFRYSRIIP